MIANHAWSLVMIGFEFRSRLSEKREDRQSQFGGEAPFQRASNFVRRPAAFAETSTFHSPFDWPKGVGGFNIIRKKSYKVSPFKYRAGHETPPCDQGGAPPWNLLRAASRGKPRAIFAARHLKISVRFLVR